MAGHPDDMWKPGFTGETAPSAPTDIAQIDPAAPDRFEIGDRFKGGLTSRETVDARGVEQVEFEAPDRVPAAPPTIEPRRRRRGLSATIVIVIALVIGALVVTGLGDDESGRPEIGEVAGADARRLPERADPLWSTTLDELRVEVGLRELLVRDDSVVALVDDEGEGSVIVALEVADGAVRWRRRFDFIPTGARILGAFDDLVVLEQNDTSDRRLLAMDLADGSTRWELPTADNGVHVALNGAKVLTRVSFTGNARLTFIDPVNGDEVARLEGRLVGTDLSGTWFVSNNQRVVAVDLADGWSEPVELVASGAQFDEPIGVVDGRVLMMDDGILSEVSADGQRTPLVVQPFGNDIIANSLIATGGASFLAVGDGKIVGATLGDDDVVTIDWSQGGSLRDGTLTAQGMVLSVVTDATGPAGRLIVDAVTGANIVEVAGPLTDAEVPQVMRDGVVVTNTELGLERVGYDLAGNERWRVAAPGIMGLGDRVLVTLEDTSDGYRISAFGDRP